MRTEFTINPHTGEMVVRRADEALLAQLQTYLGPGKDAECGQSLPVPARHDSRGSVQIASIVHGSLVDGPGLRSVAFFQGCPHHCLGCHSVYTHSLIGGIRMTVAEVVDELLRSDVPRDGVTLSGGDALVQPEACAEIVRRLKEADTHITVFTGFTYEQLLQRGNLAVEEVLDLADVLVDGPFVPALRDESLAYRGSRNQRVIDLLQTRQAGSIRLLDWD
ncbi:MAG: 4Fe-4S cluster-binding domain-containing protein [Chloroflexota bacterium]|nr:MAG: 4Fe-4S cluster-binding domain-containing protein [Chloroflexota bacterium]